MLQIDGHDRRITDDPAGDVFAPGSERSAKAARLAVAPSAAASPILILPVD